MLLVLQQQPKNNGAVIGYSREPVPPASIFRSLSFHLEIDPSAGLMPTNNWCDKYFLRNPYPRPPAPFRWEEFYPSCLEGKLYPCATLIGHIPKGFDANQGALADTRLLGKDDVLDAQCCACCS